MEYCPFGDMRTVIEKQMEEHEVLKNGLVNLPALHSGKFKLIVFQSELEILLYIYEVTLSYVLNDQT